MPNVSNAFSRPRQTMPVVQLFGLEVELEHTTRSSQLEQQAIEGGLWWQTHNDGSLRGGVEYVSPGPQTMEDSLLGLERISNIIAASQTSIRTSFHVHVDCRPWPIEQLGNVLRCYMTFEHVFYANSGGRAGSQFCVPVIGSSIERVFRDFVRTLQPGYISAVSFDTLKYSGLNVGHLSGFGSLEFRHHKGLNSAAEGARWLRMIDRFVSRARHISRNELRSAVIGEPTRLARELFGPDAVLPHDNMQYLLNFKTTEIG